MASLFKVTYSGSLPLGEQFAYSTWVGSSAGDLAGATAALAGDVAAMLGTAVSGVVGVPTDLRDAFPDGVQWLNLKTALWNAATNGQTGDADQTELDESGNGAPANAMPDQCTHAITIRGGTIGRRIYNRFFLPVYVTAATVGSGIVEQGVIDSIVAWLLQRNSDLIGAGYYTAHYSPAAATFQEATDSYIGNIVDTQRRRRNRVDEVRTTTAF